jgi:hypothetical protein
MITLQFRYMRAPLFDAIEARKRMYDAIAALPGICVEERLNGRPSFPITALMGGDNLERFIKILEDAVDQMVESHKRSSGSSKSALPMQAGETASEDGKSS